MPTEISRHLQPAEYSMENPRRQVRFAGQVSAFRKFNIEQIDLLAARRLQDGQQNDYFIQEQVTDRQLINWVSTPKDPRKISKNPYLVFGITGTRVHPSLESSQVGEIQGWRYFIEFSPGEIKDMVKKGIINQPMEGQPPLMPAGIRLPEAPGLQMQSAMRNLCAAISHLDYSFHSNRITSEARAILGYDSSRSLTSQELVLSRKVEDELWSKHPMKPTQIIATTVSPRNTRSMKSLEAAGFVRSENGMVKGTSDSEDYVYVLDWDKLNKLMKDQALNEIKNRFEPQELPLENTYI